VSRFLPSQHFVTFAALVVKLVGGVQFDAALFPNNMSNLDLRLSDVTDSDRFIIIDLYKQHSLLWSRGITVSRDKSAVIWKEIAQNVSTSNRIFTGMS
jgi:hypothetical protein